MSGLAQQPRHHRRVVAVRGGQVPAVVQRHEHDLGVEVHARLIGPGGQFLPVAVHVAGDGVGGHARLGQDADAVGVADVAAVHEGLGSESLK